MTRAAPDSSGLDVAAARVAFGARPGLEDISLQVARGERTALLGPSGAGKTSLLRAIAGLGGLSAGRVRVDGHDVTAEPPERRQVVYMHQAPGLFPHLSALDNVAFPLEVRGVTRREARRRAGGLLDRVQLGALSDRQPATLSGGQRHRVALARALAAAPAVLLLDEPFAALDPALRAEVRQAVADLLTEPTGPAVILVTHDVDEACALAGRLVVLMDGRLAQSGSPSELLATPRSLAVARFLGLPNLLHGIRDANQSVRSALGNMRVEGRPGPVVITARPSAVRLRAASPGEPAATVAGALERVTGVVVRVQIDGETLLGVADPGLDVTPGARVALDVDHAAIHVIDEQLEGI